MIIVANCIAIVASIGSFILALLQLWKGSPATPRERRRQVYLFVTLSLVSIALLVFLSLRLRNEVDTLEQTGSFETLSQGPQEIYYPIPYAGPPNLTFVVKCRGAYAYEGPSILEQRANGFKVRLDLNSACFGWKATGIRMK